MEIVMFFIFLVCDLMIVPICWYAYGKGTEYREGMLLGVHIPAQFAGDPEVSKLCRKSEKQWKWFQRINLPVSLLVCLLCFYSFGVFMAVWCIWIVQYVGGIYYLIFVPHRRMYRLKLRRGWTDERSRRIVRVDTVVSAASAKMAVSWKWHLPAIALTAATVLLIMQMGNRFDMDSAEMTAVWAMYASGISICLVFLGLHIGIARQAGRVYCEDTQINLAANCVTKRAWTKGLLCASYISAAAWIFFSACYYFFGPVLPDWSYIVYLAAAALAAASLCVPAARAAGRRRELLSADQSFYYVDDDVYWRHGWYNNPNDRHILVQDRFSSMNYSFNYGRPAVKVIIGIIAAGIAGLVIWVFGLVISLDNAEVILQEREGTYRFEAAGYEYEFEKDGIQSVKIIDELPDESFTRTNGGSTEKVNIGHFRGKETGKCMMFLYKGYSPILEIRLDGMTVFANSKEPQEVQEWLEMLSD